MEFDLELAKPNYRGRSIVNLMASIKTAFGVKSKGPSHGPGRTPGKELLEQYEHLDGLATERIKDAKRVVLLVIDGLGADLLQAFSSRPGAIGCLQANLHSRMTSVYPPTTASAITTFMSGQAPQQHGLTGWFMNFREIGATTAVLPFSPRYGRGSLSDQGVNIADLVDCESLASVLPVSSEMLLPEEIANSAFSQHVGAGAKRIPYSGIEGFIDGLKTFNTSVDGQRYMYAYWSQFDHLCHIHGPSDERVFEHFLSLEQALCPLLDEMANQGTCLLITADHGFLDSGPNERINLEEHPSLKDMLAMPLFGEPRSAYCIVRKGCDDEFEDYVRSELSHAVNLVPSQELIKQNWFGLGTPHPELAARTGDYTLQMKERFTVRDELTSERSFDLLGMHGGITAAEQWVPLIVV